MSVTRTDSLDTRARPGRERETGRAEPSRGAPARTVTVAAALVEGLRRAGVGRVFGARDGTRGPLYEAVARSAIDFVPLRDAGGAVFAALEHHHATGRPAAVVVAADHGVLEALPGVAAARADRAKLVLLSSSTGVSKWGRGAAGETSPYAAVQGALHDTHLFDLAVPVLGGDDLPEVVRRLLVGLAGRHRFVAHVSVPTSSQARSVDAHRVALSLDAPIDVAVPSVAHADARRAALLLQRAGFAIWVGAGARDASPLVRSVAERTGAGVMCSPRGKGVFPESHPLFVGVTGVGGHASALSFLERERPGRLLVLGTRLGELTSQWDRRRVPPGGVVHVDLDPAVFGAAYPHVPTFGIQADVSAFLRELLPCLREAGPSPRSSLPVHPLAVDLREEGAVRPQALMDAVQHVVVERSDAVVLSESGPAFAWANHHLRFDRPRRYRAGATAGSRGRMACGVVGAALGRGGPAVAVVDERSMLEGQEIRTALGAGARAVWIVLNEARRRASATSVRADVSAPGETEIPRADFVAFARSLGADGATVTSETDLAPSLERALAAKGPFVVDVLLDAAESSPMSSDRGHLPDADGEVLD